jgi:CheY-like chemotaxis protein
MDSLLVEGKAYVRASNPLALAGVQALVVDDEAAVRQAVAAMLEQRGARVTVAGSASEALETLQRLRPDIIVSDIEMPGEDGYGLMRKVRALDPRQGGSTPAVALTAYVGSQSRRRALAVGYQTHVAKPVEPTALVAAVAGLTVRQAPLEAGQ